MMRSHKGYVNKLKSLSKKAVSTAFLSNSNHPSNPLPKLVVMGIDFNLVADLHESRNRNLKSCSHQTGRLHDFSRGITAHGRFGIFNLTDNRIRQFNGNGLAVIKS